MKIALAQINPIVGDLNYNKAKIMEAVAKAEAAGAEIVIFSELATTGYPPRDLLLKEAFVEANYRTVQEIAASVKETGVILGTVWKKDGKLYDVAVLAYDGKIRDVVYKALLPNYDVFDEKRYFEPGQERHLTQFKGLKLGISICEDIWNDKDFWERALYDVDPIAELAQQEPDLLINLSASPYHFRKAALRQKMLAAVTKKYNLGLVYVNQVGGNDELVFDGRSLVLDNEGRTVAVGESFEEDLFVVDTDLLNEKNKGVQIKENVGDIENALVLGLRDYLLKTGFNRAVIGISGGIDSALVAYLACRAIGVENVLGIAMPSVCSSAGSIEDAHKLARNLGFELKTVSIGDLFGNYLKVINNEESPCYDVAEENIQARIRGNILMFYSNRENRIVLTTGNKSEVAVGYCTLYGDMCGGLAVLSDVPKTVVYALSKWINRNGEVIPEEIINKAPSAELKPDQRDTDSLPPYPVLDKILKLIVEENKSLPEIAAMGFPEDLIKRVGRMVKNNEYKRYQAPPGIRVTSKAFGSGRRVPIAQGWVW